MSSGTKVDKSISYLHTQKTFRAIRYRHRRMILVVRFRFISHFPLNEFNFVYFIASGSLIRDPEEKNLFHCFWFINPGSRRGKSIGIRSWPPPRISVRLMGFSIFQLSISKFVRYYCSSRCDWPRGWICISCSPFLRDLSQ